MKIKDSQELAVILPAKEGLWHLTAGTIRGWPSPDIIHDSMHDALCRLEGLLDVGCYSTYIRVETGKQIAMIDGKPAMMVLAMPEDPLLAEYGTEKLEETL